MAQLEPHTDPAAPLGAAHRPSHRRAPSSGALSSDLSACCTIPFLLPTSGPRPPTATRRGAFTIVSFVPTPRNGRLPGSYARRSCRSPKAGIPESSAETPPGSAGSIKSLRSRGSGSTPSITRKRSDTAPAAVRSVAGKRKRPRDEPRRAALYAERDAQVGRASDGCCSPLRARRLPQPRRLHATR